MAFTKTLPTDVLSSIANQIGARLEPTTGGELHFMDLESVPLPMQGLEVCETFEVWKLVPDAIDEIANGNVDITKLTRQSGLWQHQLRDNRKAIGFARSKPLGAEATSWSVRDIFTSDLAGKIDLAIAWIDSNIPEEQVEVRLLSIPSQQVEAFWFVSDPLGPAAQWNNQLLIINAADNFASLGAPVDSNLGPLADSESFLAALPTRKRGMGIT